MEKQHVRQERYHVHGLALAFQAAGTARCLSFHSGEAAAIIASVEGLIWKIWVLQQERFEIGGIYLFASRETAEAYLNHPVIQAVCSNSAVVSTQSHLWDVESSLSALTRAPLTDFRAQHSEPQTVMAGGQ